MAAPALPQGWTEHIGPGGSPYFYHIHTKESTYVRPLPVIYGAAAPKQQKEKPKTKTPIAGTDWIRVETTSGNVFYSNKVTKKSEWTEPEEVKEAIAALERGKEEDEPMDEEPAAAKRKAEAPEEPALPKRARVEEDSGEESEEEEEWQREAAATLAAEAEVEKLRVQEEEKREKAEAEAAAKKALEQAAIPRIELALPEAQALFKTLLREKDINPLHPWDLALPLFVSDPRYVLLSSVNARKEAFDEYCRDRARELRQSNVKKAKAEADPKGEFERLLVDEVKSTRTSWTDFRRAWKKDRRFYGWGRDDREREKRFREFVKDLGEKKRAAAQKAEADFFTLLRESSFANAESSWKDAKRKLANDPRYEAVGSSSLREELWNTFLKGTGNTTLSQEEPGEVNPDAAKDPVDEAQQRKERKERAVKEREQQVKANRGRVDLELGRSRQTLVQDEGQRDFRSLLTDAIRDPQATWDSALPQLKTDPRLVNSPLPFNQQVHLFHEHVGQLRAKHVQSLRALFQAHAPSLATDLTTLPLESILSALPATKLGLDESSLECEYQVWQRERTTQARQDFEEMLGENTFVEFWGRLGKIGGEGVDGGVKADENEDEEEGESGGGKVDMKALAKSVNVQEIEQVLVNDKRYIMFEHTPSQREQWIRDYLARLSAPKKTVHLQEKA